MLIRDWQENFRIWPCSEQTLTTATSFSVVLNKKKVGKTFSNKILDKSSAASSGEPRSNRTVTRCSTSDESNETLKSQRGRRGFGAMTSALNIHYCEQRKRTSGILKLEPTSLRCGRTHYSGQVLSTREFWHSGQYLLCVSLVPQANAGQKKSRKKNGLKRRIGQVNYCNLGGALQPCYSTDKVISSDFQSQSLYCNSAALWFYARRIECVWFMKGCV